MIGAILGDMIGSPYEFDRSPKTKEFPLFSKYSQFTDDSVMTVAVADALLSAMGKTDDEIKAALVESMQKWGQKYPDAGYGGMFYRWLRSKQPEPYGSYGNGSAMRVSAAGWLYDTMEETRHIARLTAEVTHNHPEGIKGAEATASAIFMARKGSNKGDIRAYIIQEFGYDLSRTCDQIRPTYHHVESCQQTVPEAITAFLEGTNFEDVIRTAVSLGGDCDTLTCIACGIAEAFYDVPKEMLLECKKRLPDDMLEVITRFMDCRKSSFHDPFLAGNELIEEAIDRFYMDSCKKNLVGVLEAIRQRMHADGHFMFPVVSSDDGKSFAFRTVQTKDGKEWVAAFTSPAEHEKGEPSEIVSNFIDIMLKEALTSDHSGFIINPWGKSFMLAKELIQMIFKADGDVEYTVPDDALTVDLLEDGSYLKKAIEICNRNRTQMNMLKLMKILRDSWVWVPCNAVMSETDNDAVLKMIQEAEENGGLDKLVGKTITNQDQIRMVPDILQNGDEFFFPVFSTAEDMGKYGESFSKVQRHFLEAVNLARNNKKKVTGIVINAFTEPFVMPMELLDIISEMDSAIENPENE